MAGCAMMMSGCQCSDNGSTGSAAIDRQSIETNVREFVYPLPTAFEVTEMLNRIGGAGTSDRIVTIVDDALSTNGKDIFVITSQDGKPCIKNEAFRSGFQQVAICLRTSRNHL